MVDSISKRTASVTDGNWLIYTGDLGLTTVGQQFEVAGLDINGNIIIKTTVVVKNK